MQINELFPALNPVISAFDKIGAPTGNLSAAGVKSLPAGHHR